MEKYTLEPLDSLNLRLPCMSCPFRALVSACARLGKWKVIPGRFFDGPNFLYCLEFADLTLTDSVLPSPQGSFWQVVSRVTAINKRIACHTTLHSLPSRPPTAAVMIRCSARARPRCSLMGVTQRLCLKYYLTNTGRLIQVPKRC